MARGRTASLGIFPVGHGLLKFIEHWAYRAKMNSSLIKVPNILTVAKVLMLMLPLLLLFVCFDDRIGQNV